MAKYTPMMEQYINIKNQYPYCLVFFRLGDFYELFFDDALIASKELDIVLTGRDCGQEERAPMCGVPHHAAEGYIARLIEKGYKVAVCEQTEDPKTAKTIVRRDVIRVVTPGTVFDQNLLDSGKNNFIAAVYEDSQSFGVSAADVTTGEFYALSVDKASGSLPDELARFGPAEIVAAEGLSCAKDIESLFKLKLTSIEGFPFDFQTAYKKLCSHFGTFNLAGFGLEGDKPAVCASGGLLYYLLETQKNPLKHLSAIKPYKKESHMAIDLSSRRNLELCETLREKRKTGSLLWVMDKTKTPMGARLLRKWITEPLTDAGEIEARLDAVAEYKNGAFLREEIKDRLNAVHDMERLLSRIIYGICSGRDVIALKISIKALPEIKNLLNSCKSVLNRYFFDETDVLRDVYELIETSVSDNPPAGITDGGLIKEGFNAELDGYREVKAKGAGWILELEAKEKELTGIKNLRIRYNKVFGYYFEVTKSNQKLVPERFIRTQTLANSERYATPELKELEETILSADEKITALEYRLFTEIREKISAEAARIQATANILAAIDALRSMGEIADKYNYVRPKINKNGVIDIKDGRHPVVERALETGFVPNDAYLNQSGERLLILTGPNMAGKSTYMRQIALIVLMAQAGSFVPAKYADISPADRIFTRVGASDDLATGQSTFMVEMTEVSNILNNATKDSLIILDEIGRGTSTYDGLSIAWAVLEYIADTNGVGAKTLFATHYHEMTELEGKVPGVVNYCVTVKESGEDIIFLRKIARGGADRSYGIHVARLAGLPQTVINRAREILLALDEADIAKKRSGGEDSAQYKTETAASKNNKIIMKELEEIKVEALTAREALKRITVWKELSR